MGRLDLKVVTYQAHGDHFFPTYFCPQWTHWLNPNYDKQTLQEEQFQTQGSWPSTFSTIPTTARRKLKQTDSTKSKVRFAIPDPTRRPHQITDIASSMDTFNTHHHPTHSRHMSRFSWDECLITGSGWLVVSMLSIHVSLEGNVWFELPYLKAESCIGKKKKILKIQKS